MTNQTDEYYRVLGLDPGASPEEIKKAYRDMAKVWHPDRFPNDPHLQSKGNEQFKKVTEAYEKLIKHQASENTFSSQAHKSPEDSGKQPGAHTQGHQPHSQKTSLDKHQTKKTLEHSKKYSTWEFGKLFLFRPSEAADACHSKDALKNGLIIYAVLAVAELISSWFNPLAFLDPNAPVMAPHTALFWLRVAMWEPVLFGLSVIITVLILDWMREGWLPLKTAAATLWSAVPVILALRYVAPAMAFGKGATIALLALWVIPAAALARRVPLERWRKIGVFLLGLNAIQIVCLAAEFVTVVPARSLHGFYALSFLTIAWLLVCVGVGLRKLCETSTARVVLGFLFSVLVISVVPAVAYLVGLMPMEVLKIVLYV